MNKKLIFIDTETGGLNSSIHSLLTIGLVVYENNTILEEKEILIKKDEYNVTKEAMDVNKLDLEDLKINGVSELEAILMIEDICKRHFGDSKITVVGHNINFDLGFIKSMYERNNKYFYKYFTYRNIDTMSILKFLYYANKIPNHIGCLDDAIKYFNIEIDKEKRHTALTDALITLKVYEKICEL